MSNYIAKKNNQSLDVWQIVKTDIENKILSGYYAAGHKLPSIRQISEEYGVGQTTAQKVFTVLTREGIIESKHGIGHYVNAYIRERLIAERKWNLEKRAKELVEEADLIGVDLLPIIKRLSDKE